MKLKTFFQRLFRALRYRNYRVFFFAQIISLVGVWMQQIAMVWLVYRLTNSALMLGVIGFLSQVPLLIFGPMGGIIADRYAKRRILLFTQISFMLIALIFALLVFSGHTDITSFFLLALIFGTINSFDTPARQAIFAELIDDKKDIANAVALNSVAFHGARFVGPAIAGILIKFSNEGVCFLLNGLSYLAVIWALLYLPRVAASVKKTVSYRDYFSEGLHYIKNSPSITAIIFLVMIISLMGMPYLIILPAVIKEVFQGDSALLGLFMSVGGIGAMTGAIYLASREKVTNLSSIMLITSVSLGLSLILLPLSPTILSGLLIMLVLSFSMMMQLGSSNVILQTIADHQLRGRLMSVYSMAFAGMTPFGNLLFGYLSSRIGLQNTMAMGGACCILAGLIFSFKAPSVRQKLIICTETEIIV